MSVAPPVSVLLPVWNAAPFLDASLGSLGAQTFEDFEVLVQDDGSTDGSRDIAEAWARRDRRFRIDTGTHQGLVFALNRAAQRARGSLLVRMDADDVARADRIERLVVAARDHTDTDHFSSLVRYVPREAVGEGMRRYETWINAVRSHDDIVRARFIECPVPHPTWALRRRLFDGLGGYRQGTFPEDYDFFLRAVEAGARFHKVEEVLLSWREGPHRASRTDERYSLNAFFDLKARFLVSFLRAAGASVAIAGAGKAGKRWAKLLRREGVEVRHWLSRSDDRVGTRIQDLPVVGWGAVEILERDLVLCTVGAQGGREELRARLVEAGLVEGQRFLCLQ